MGKWIASGVVALGLLALPAAVSTAQAHERDNHPVYESHRHHDDCFEVMYRRCSDDPWSCYGRFDRREEAEHAEHHLRRHGFEAFVRRVSFTEPYERAGGGRLS